MALFFIILANYPLKISCIPPILTLFFPLIIYFRVHQGIFTSLRNSLNQRNDLLESRAFLNLSHQLSASCYLVSDQSEIFFPFAVSSTQEAFSILNAFQGYR